MNRENLFRAIGEADDEWIRLCDEEPQRPAGRKNDAWIKYAAAACFVLAAVFGGMSLLQKDASPEVVPSSESDNFGGAASDPETESDDEAVYAEIIRCRNENGVTQMVTGGAMDGSTPEYVEQVKEIVAAAGSQEDPRTEDSSEPEEWITLRIMDGPDSPGSSEEYRFYMLDGICRAAVAEDGKYMLIGRIDSEDYLTLQCIADSFGPIVQAEETMDSSNYDTLAAYCEYFGLSADLVRMEVRYAVYSETADGKIKIDTITSNVSDVLPVMDCVLGNAAPRIDAVPNMENIRRQGNIYIVWFEKDIGEQIDIWTVWKAGYLCGGNTLDAVYEIGEDAAAGLAELTGAVFYEVPESKA